MDPLSASITIILGKYALDKGAELAKEAGPAALEKARDIVTTALGRLRKDPAGEFVAKGFEKSPQGYQEPLQEKLAEIIEADPDFAAKLETLLEAYETAAQEHAAATGATYQASLEGSGAIAQGEGAVAAGKGGVAVGGNVEGGVRLGRQAEDEAEIPPAEKPPKEKKQ